jgi:hypothetical protein
MLIPTDFQENIKNNFGKKGLLWLGSLANLLELIADKWQLSDISPVSNLSYNYVWKRNTVGCYTAFRTAVFHLLDQSLL